ncbi:MAG TPA: DUF885 domain-containing protein, partial [Anaerolineaceae bacterium]|nr:DUF885 domain-containing protein [Anaerolineaceae bacterium]
MGWVIFAIVLAAIAYFVARLIWFKPFSINHFFNRFFFRLALRQPELLSQLGILEKFGLHFHNDDLSDASDAFEVRELAYARREYAVLKSYDPAKLSPEQRLSAEIMGWFLKDMLDGERWRHHNYPLNQMFGLQSGFPDFMATIHRVDSLRGARNYIKRLSKSGKKFEQILDGLKIRESKGVIPPRFVIRRVLDEMIAFIGKPTRENMLYTVFAEKLGKLKLEESQRTTLLGAAEAEIHNTVYPAYQKLIDYFNALEPVATSDDGVWKLPDGEAFYNYKLRSETTTDLSAEQIHQIGLDEVTRIETEMRRILAAEGYPDANIAEQLQAFNQEPRFLYPNTDEGRQQALKDYQAIIDHVDQNLGNLFDRRPKMGVQVERIPEFKEKTAPGAYYNPPSMDGARPGVFYANLRDMNEVPQFGMRTLAYHEAIPGHHFQLALAQELKGLPIFRQILPFTAYAEGWALYAEKLAYENGFLPDAYSQLGYLASELFRAVRLVVDTGLHAKRWTREQAIEYMLAHT